jgi:uncharacterized lipoprotein YehR (DUF1307 family)
MKKIKLAFWSTSIVLTFYSCFNKSNSEVTHENSLKNTDYIKMLEEIHDIECTHLQKEDILLNDTSVYSIRSVAFQAVMKNKDRKVLARYEDLYQKLADIEHAMNADQKNKYRLETEEIYKKKCK